MFTIIELQTLANGQTNSLTQTAGTLNQAEAKYHTILAAAAISQVPVHACALLTHQGRLIANEYYRHGETTSPEENMEE